MQLSDASLSIDRIHKDLSLEMLALVSKNVKNYQGQ